MADLFAGCSSGEEDTGDLLRTDNVYARNYDGWRSKEELMKAKARYGSDLEVSSGGSDSSDAEEEDENASQWTSEHEKKFLVTLSALKGHDPKIYKKDEVIFGEVQTARNEDNEAMKVTDTAGGSDETEKAASFKGQKRMTLKDYERKIISEEGGRYVDDEDVEGPRARLFEATQQEKLAYDDEQRALRDSLKAAAWGEDDASEEDNDPAGGLVSRKQRKKEQEIQDEEDYVKWLKGETDRLSNKKEAKELADLKRLWTESGEEKLDEAEKFLRDYVLNKRYLTAKADDFKLEVDLSEDEKDIEEMNEFEHKYNFRFEDPDPEFIKRYPRTIEDSMRRKDTRRSDKKAEKKARREQERVQLREEVNRLKSMKKKEIINKIDKLKSIAGSADIAFDDADIDGDFDPDEHDRRMAALFASYDEQAGEDLYPELEDNDNDIEDLRYEDWDKYEGVKVASERGEDPSDSENESDPGRADRKDEPGSSGISKSKKASNDPEASESESDISSNDEKGEVEHGGAELAGSDEDDDIHEKEVAGSGIERTDEGKLLVRGKKSAKLTLEDILPQKKEKKRKKSKFAEVLAKNRPTFDPERDQNFEKYFDEYYKLDFEDVVGGLQTRFKYRQVVPNDFGLSTEEVLNAQDKELNKWCTLKKMVQFRSQEEENKDVEVFSNRRNHMHLKQKILASVYSTDVEKPDAEIIQAAAEAGTVTDTKSKSKSRKNKKKKQRAAVEIPTSPGDNVEESADIDDVDEGEDHTNRGDTEISSKKRKGGPTDSGDEVAGGGRKQKKQKIVKGEHADRDGDDQADRMKIRGDRPPVERRTSESVDFDTNERDRKKNSINKQKSPHKRMNQQRATDNGKFAKKFHDKGSRFGDKRHSSSNKKNQKKEKISNKEIDCKAKKTSKTNPEGDSSEVTKADTVPWDQLTAKQKKNRRNAMIKKRKKAEMKELKMEKAIKHKSKFRPLEDLQMSEARMKAYGLNPNRVKGNLVYSSGIPGKNKLKTKQGEGPAGQ